MTRQIGLGKLGFICVPRTVALAVEMARASEAGGLWGLGIGDSQASYMEAYSVATACLLATTSLTVGPVVTNPVTRHWSVHAAAARALDEIAPGRYVLGLSSGNSSVRSIDGPPSTPQAVGAELTRIRSAMPSRVTVLIAADGPRMAAVAGEHADGLIIGTGLDAEATGRLWEIARTARRDAGVERPLEPWIVVHLKLVEQERAVEAARASTTGIAISLARRAFAGSFAGKNVPAAYQDILRERLARYDMRHHGSIDGPNPNAELLADHPEIEAYVRDRFGIVGTPEMCRERLEAVVKEVGIGNVWFSAVVEDPVQNIELAARAFGRPARRAAQPSG